MTKRPPPVWQLPAILGGIVVGVGAMGTGLIKLAAFLSLPGRVEASEQVNRAQDKILDRVTAVLEAQQQMQQAQQPKTQPPEVLRSTDRWGRAWCCPATVDCHDATQWTRCAEEP